ASTPGKKEAYRHSLRLFRKAAKHYEPPLAIIEIPFEGKTLVGSLQIPAGIAKPPVVMHWGGVDGWKENRQRASSFFHRAGIATLTVDMPGTGENLVPYGAPVAELRTPPGSIISSNATTSTAAASACGAEA